MADTNDISGFLVSLEIDGDQALFIMLGADGSINRLGTGSVSNTDRDMYIGKAQPAVFESLKTAVTDELISFMGQSREDPSPKGAACTLKVGIQRSSDEEFTMWRYGAESQGPPPPVGTFVRAAVKATNPWHSQQVAIAANAAAPRRRWWEIWK